MTVLILLAAGFVAFANGANDNFKGVATLYGSRTLGYRPALAWATGTTLAGSLSAMALAGGLVKRFSGKGLVAEAIAADPRFLLAVAIAAAATVMLATRLGLPISTTHALMGGLMGAGAVMAGPSHLAYSTLGTSFALPLVLSPLLSLLLTATLYTSLRWARLQLGVTEQTCVCVGGVEQVAAFVPGGAAVRLATGLVVSVDSLERCERRYAGTVLGWQAQTLLNRLHVLTAGAVGFARGLNDTPKVVALVVAAQLLGVGGGMLTAALVMALGGLLLARRIAETLSFRITGMNHGQGFTANLVTAAIVTLASPLGLPVSTTHVACGALFGLGAVNGEARWKTIAQLLSAWVTTLPAAAALGAAAALMTTNLR